MVRCVMVVNQKHVSVNGTVSTVLFRKRWALLRSLRSLRCPPPYGVPPPGPVACTVLLFIDGVMTGPLKQTHGGEKPPPPDSLMLDAWSVLLVWIIGRPSARSDFTCEDVTSGHGSVPSQFDVTSKLQGHVHGCNLRLRLEYFCNFDLAHPPGERNRAGNRQLPQLAKADPPLAYEGVSSFSR